MDWQDFADWIVTDADDSPTTADDSLRAVRQMTREGVDWNEFLASPDSARAAVRPVLAAKRREGKPHALRRLQKVLNRVTRYVGAVHDPRYLAVHWDLAEAPPRSLDPYTIGEQDILMQYRHRNAIKEKRRRAMLWFLFYLGDRRMQVHGFRVTDLDRDRCAVRIRKGVKKGQPRWENLPAATWSPKRAVVAWLRLREQLLGDRASDAFWITEDGRDMTLSGFSNEMYAIRRETGVLCNFNRFRHTRGTIYEEHGVPVQTLMREWGHTDPKSTLHYMQARPETRAVVLEKASVPGFRRHRRSLARLKRSA